MNYLAQIHANYIVYPRQSFLVSCGHILQSSHDMCSLCPAGYHDGTSEEDESSDDGEFSDAEVDFHLKPFDDEQEAGQGQQDTDSEEDGASYKLVWTDTDE